MVIAASLGACVNVELPGCLMTNCLRKFLKIVVVFKIVVECQHELVYGFSPPEGG